MAPGKQQPPGTRLRGAAFLLALLCTLLLVVVGCVMVSRAAVRGCGACLSSGAAAGAPPWAPPIGRGPGGHDHDAARAAAAAVAAPNKQGQPAVFGHPHGIPRILHRIYIADPADRKRASFTAPIAHERWVESCQFAHSRHAGWRLMFWDWRNTEALVRNHYPWFLPFYRHNASRAIEKSDLARYAILHRVGGLYLDSDIQCWRDGSDMLEGFDLVAQSTHGAEGATNAAIAAVPGLQVFVKALQLVQTRVGKDNQQLNVIARTGPDLFTDALVEIGLKRGKDGLFPPSSYVKGVVYRLHRSGTWYNPCLWWEQECRQRVYRELASGMTNMSQLAGFHRMVGSWIAGKEDGIGILNTTAELCGGVSHVRGNGQIGGWVAPQRKGRQGSNPLGGGGPNQQQG